MVGAVRSAPRRTTSDCAPAVPRGQGQARAFARLGLGGPGPSARAAACPALAGLARGARRPASGTHRGVRAALAGGIAAARSSLPPRARPEGDTEARVDGSPGSARRPTESPSSPLAASPPAPASSGCRSPGARRGRGRVGGPAAAPAPRAATRWRWPWRGCGGPT